MANRKPRRAPPSGLAVDVLLSLSVVAVGLIVAAYLRLPDFQRGVQRLAADVERGIMADRD